MVTGYPAFGRVATGSAVSRLVWQAPGELGDVQAGTKLLPKGLFIHSEISWLRGVTSATLPPRIPGSSQLAQTSVWIRCVFSTCPVSYAVWKPSTQQRFV